MPKPDLESAYDLRGTRQTVEFYREWAESYDRDFAESRGYATPREVARIFRSVSIGNETILDIGAGTGLVGQELSEFTLDAIDISPEMLDVAAKKGVYRNTITADLTQSLDLPSGSYGGMVSAGTFTHGHVGAECLPELLRVAQSDALFVCGVAPGVFDEKGFGSALALLVAKNEITPVWFHDFAFYDQAAGSHANDRGLIMVFRKI